MLPKLKACADAVEAGVGFAHIVDGRKPHSLLLELFTDAGIGTKVSSADERCGPGRAPTQELAALDEAHVMRTYARQPAAFVRGEGATLYDADGEAYLDFLAGISVCNTGHCHPRVVEAIREQAERLLHASNLYLTEPAARLAERLAAASAPDARVFFGNSGAEANEAAIKLARKRRRGGEIVVLEGAFHGRTMGALSATPQETKQEPFAPLVPGFVAVPRDDPAALDARGRRADRRRADRAGPGRVGRLADRRTRCWRRRARRATAAARC